MSYKFNPFSGNFDIVGSASGGTGDPGGSNTQVQFNDSGAFGGDSTFTFNKTTDTLTVANIGATGNVTLGDANTDTLTINGTAVACPNNLNFDNNTLIIDAANNRIGLGVSPYYMLHLGGGASGAINGTIALGEVVGVPSALIQGYRTDGSFAGELIVSTTAQAGSISERLRINSVGNVGINTATFGTSAATVLGIKTGTAPTTGPADTIQLYSTDLSAGNTILSLFTEGTGATTAGITNVTVTNKIAIRVNGTVYYLLATTNGT